MHFYLVSSFPSPGKRMREREKENKPHVASIAHVVQCTLRSDSNTIVLMAIHELAQKQKVVLGKLL